MQVSIACTDHNLKRGNGDHSKQSATSPNVVNQARAKFRTVAIIARSFGSFTPRHISLKESTGKHTGMKYRNLGKSGLRVSCLGLGTRPQLQDDAFNDTLSSFIYIRPRSPRKSPLVAAQKSLQLLSSHYSATRLSAAINPNILTRSNIVRSVTGEIGINIR